MDDELLLHQLDCSLEHVSAEANGDFEVTVYHSTVDALLSVGEVIG